MFFKKSKIEETLKCKDCGAETPKKWINKKGYCYKCAGKHFKEEELIKNETSLDTKNNKKTSTVKIEFYHDLEQFHFIMRDNQNIEYDFILGGKRCYFPNRSSTCGYGSDDFYFNCLTKEGMCGILMFSESAEYGSGWFFSPINSEEKTILETATEGEEWITLWYNNMKDRLYHLHPCDISSAKLLIKETVLRTGKVTDDTLFGY